MRLDQEKIDLLWKRCSETKHRMDRAHNQITAPSANGQFTRAVLAVERAAKDYRQAMNEYTAAAGVDQSPNTGLPPSTGETRSQSLTPREREVLRLIASGKSSREIAGILGIASKTVAVHRQSIHTKLRVHNTPELVRAAMKMGLIDG